MASPDDMDRVIESGDAMYSGAGVKISSKAKKRDGDESVAMASTLGSDSGSWMSDLNDGCKNPYPYTVTALKNKNSRDSNDSFK